MLSMLYDGRTDSFGECKESPKRERRATRRGRAAILTVILVF